MTEATYAAALRAQLSRAEGRAPGPHRHREVARLLSPWRRHGAGPDIGVRGG